LSLAVLAAVRLFFEKQAILWNDWSFNDTLWYGYNKVNLTVVVCGVLRNEYCSHLKCWLLEFWVYIIVVSESLVQLLSSYAVCVLVWPWKLASQAHVDLDSLPESNTS
jgi:hypothetical protein